MLKKHLITCSVMLGLLLIAKLFIYNTPADINRYINLSFEPLNSENKVEPYFNTLSFANETLPLDDKRIRSKMYKYLEAHSFEKLNSSKLHRKAEQWFPIIEPILSEYGIPSDFKYMPLVESGLQGGISPKGAAGYWQFMPQTARDFGLKVNSQIDERNNIQKSTVAAAKYLKSLYKEFGSWTMAAAAYNIGEGKLKRQIDDQKQGNYFKMKLNRETASYVYKLISMKEIIENPTRYGYTNKVNSLLAKENAPVEMDFPFEGISKSITPQILRN